MFGAFAFGQGYYGQGFTVGSAPPDVPAVADVVVLVMAPAAEIQIRAVLTVVVVRPDVERVEI